MKSKAQHKITYFKPEEIQGISLPEKFTFPFFYQPHPLTELAAKDLHHYLENEFDAHHNFGLNPSAEGLVIGKMFGVLVVQDEDGRLGYLSAFSGKLAGSNAHDKFVPPVFDMLTENSFFLKEEEILNAINRQIEDIQKTDEFVQAKLDFIKDSQISADEIADYRALMKANKAERKTIREAQKEILNQAEYTALEEDLIKQSYRDQYEFKVLKDRWKERLTDLQTTIDHFENTIEQLKIERKEKSNALQNQLFDQYSFLDQNGNTKNLRDIFKETVFERPPAAAGECATPKLLQFAFLHRLKPISFAEFWWGASPKSEIRKHKHYYPACSGKCRPILKHMLNGIETEDNPLLQNLAEDKQLKIVYEDQYLVVVNKPAELLSVPGLEIQDSVYSRLQEIMGGIEPLIVHRLDMSTSGLLVVAKAKEVHKHIQAQFLRHRVKKRYTALLAGKLTQKSGRIEVPMRPDPFDRPRQKVCFEKGKKAITEFEVIQENEDTTKVHFWPITGRTHQLRVHAAHELGLNAPIVGDDLYGVADERLHLHAGVLEFLHPITKENLIFEVEAEF